MKRVLQMQLDPGTRVGPYEIASQIGEGGMGQVYCARDTRLGRDVAIKMISAEARQSSDADERFQREAKSVASLSHPNIIALFDIGTTEDGALYLVTELLSGRTLRAVVDHGAMPWQRVAEIGAQIACGIDAAHTKGLLHRDLKPDNVFLTTEDVVKVLDFGLVRAVLPTRDLKVAQSRVPTAPAALTSRGIVLGTPGYMSPEQIRGRELGPASDLFSLGCVLYELLTGNALYRRWSYEGIVAAVLEEPPPKIEDDTIPREITTIVERLLQKKPSDRYESAKDVATALRAVATHGPNRPRPMVWATAAIAVAATIGIGAFVAGRRNGNTPPPPVPAQTATQAAIAVLPFTHSGSPDAQYVTASFGDAIGNALALAPRLKVFSTSSVRATGSDDAKAIGKILGANILVRGSVNHGPNVAVEVRIIDAISGETKRAWNADAPSTQVFSLEQRAVEWVTHEIAPDAARSVGKERPAPDPDAHRLYLRARHEWKKRTAASLLEAIRLLREAIDTDPTYAEAYAGLADAYGSAIIFGALPGEEAIPMLRAAAIRAAEIDEELAEAHVSLGYLYLFFDHDLARAETEYKRAIALNPNLTSARQGYSELLVLRGRFAEARAETAHAVELDPLSPITRLIACWNRYMMRDFKGSIDVGRKAMADFPKEPITATPFIHAYIQTQRYDEADAAIKAGSTIARSSAERMFFSVAKECVRAARGDRVGARAAIEELQRTNTALPSFYFARAFAIAGDTTRAVDMLERAHETRDGNGIWLQVDPAFDPLRDDARFQAVRKKYGF